MYDCLDTLITFTFVECNFLLFLECDWVNKHGDDACFGANLI